MTKKTGIASDLLDGMLDSKKGRPAPSRTKKGPSKAKKGRYTFHLDQALLEEVRDAVSALSGPPLHLTMAAFAETALRRELQRLQKAENGGEPFPPRQQDLKGGRRVGR